MKNLNEYNKRYYEENIDKIKAYRKKYYEKNYEKLKAYNAKYQKEHAQKVNQRAKEKYHRIHGYKKQYLIMNNMTGECQIHNSLRKAARLYHVSVAKLKLILETGGSWKGLSADIVDGAPV